MRVVHITAGAGGRICGSCLHDNALVKALLARGCDALLVPAYVPTTTDEENVAIDRVVLGGVNVWLQEHVPLFRSTPRFVDRLFDAPRLLAWLSARTGDTRPEELGALTVSTLEGERGHQAKEVERLCRWLADEVRPDVVHLSNALLVGLARGVRRATGARIVASLSGEDIFIERIRPPHYAAVRRLLVERSADVHRFVALNRAFAAFMADYLAVPAERIAVVPHGVERAGFPDAAPDLVARRRARGGRLVVGFLARACPEKGLEQLVRALPLLCRGRDVEVLAAGAEVPAERDYRARCLGLAAELGVAGRFRWLGQVDRAEKLRLLGSIDVFAMPTLFPEAKGIPVIESFAAGVPAVAPDHGAFPELLDGERAGLLHRPADPVALAAAIGRLLDDERLAAACGRHAHALALARYSADGMAAAHESLYRTLVGAGAAGGGGRQPNADDRRS